MKLIKGSFLAVALVGLGATIPTAANASLVMRLTDSAGPTTAIVIDDLLAGGVSSGGNVATNADGFAGAGVINFTGSLGTWNVVVATGSSKPATGSAANPTLDLNSVQISGGGGGILTLELTDTDYQASGGISTLSSGVGGTNQGTLSFQSYVDDGNGEFAKTTQLFDSGAINTSPFAVGNSANAALSGPFSITLVATIDHGTDVGAISSFDFEISVPEPAPLALLGLGLIGMVAASKRRKA